MVGAHKHLATAYAWAFDLPPALPYFDTYRHTEPT